MKKYPSSAKVLLRLLFSVIEFSYKNEFAIAISMVSEAKFDLCICPFQCPCSAFVLMSVCMYIHMYVRTDIV